MDTRQQQQQQHQPPQHQQRRRRMMLSQPTMRVSRDILVGNRSTVARFTFLTSFVKRRNIARCVSWSRSCSTNILTCYIRISTIAQAYEVTTSPMSKLDFSTKSTFDIAISFLERRSSAWRTSSWGSVMLKSSNNSLKFATRSSQTTPRQMTSVDSFASIASQLFLTHTATDRRWCHCFTLRGRLII